MLQNLSITKRPRPLDLAGNDRKLVAQYAPTSCSESIIVTNVDHNCTVTTDPVTKVKTRDCPPAYSSNYLPASGGGGLTGYRYRTVSAPGVGITSTGGAGKYIVKTGTSMAAPHVAGVALRLVCCGCARGCDGRVTERQMAPGMTLREVCVSIDRGRWKGKS
jgi:subtilisin family serine protease